MLILRNSSGFSPIGCYNRPQGMSRIHVVCGFYVATVPGLHVCCLLAQSLHRSGCPEIAPAADGEESVICFVLAAMMAAPSAHGEGIHALLEPLLFVVVALGVWLFTRFQSRRSADVEQEPASGDE
jgi:hypothetical protein